MEININTVVTTKNGVLELNGVKYVITVISSNGIMNSVVCHLSKNRIIDNSEIEVTIGCIRRENDQFYLTIDESEDALIHLSTFNEIYNQFENELRAE